MDKLNVVRQMVNVKGAAIAAAEPAGTSKQRAAKLLCNRPFASQYSGSLLLRSPERTGCSWLAAGCKLAPSASGLQLAGCWLHTRACSCAHSNRLVPP